ncbi:hypothetical protein HN873_002996 [Arachis hypogaea]
MVQIERIVASVASRTISLARFNIWSIDVKEIEGGTFVVLEIVEDGPWWYSVCVCGRGVQAESEVYFCQFCNIHVTNVTPRFRMKVLVEDSTGCVWYTISSYLSRDS